MENKVLETVNSLVDEFLSYYKKKNRSEWDNMMIQSKHDQIWGAVKLARTLGIELVTTLEVEEDGYSTYITHFRVKEK